MKARAPQILFVSLALIAAMSACRTARGPYDPDRKFAPDALRSDYTLFRKILEDTHPSLYWYTPKDSIGRTFDAGYAAIRDSMTEVRFRFLLSYVVSRINCGHTAVHYSKAYDRWADTVRGLSFPLALKFWADTMLVTANLYRGDRIFRRGVQLTSVNGYSAAMLRDSLFNFLTTDGYSLSGKYQGLSTGFNFATLYKHVFGLADSFRIGYIDSLGFPREASLAPFDFRADTLGANTKKKREQARFSRFPSRSLQLDTGLKTAFMTLNTFDRSKNHLRRFFRRGFAAMHRNGTQNLVIDVRANGGGDAGISTLLTRYLIDRKFRVADSLYALHRYSRYGRYMSDEFLPGLLLPFVTRKRADGYYHFGYFERHYFRPRARHHFDGQVYILIGGNSFSATTLFAGALKGQRNITLVGEETGGGFYGNTAWIIPDVTLPNTGVRLRIPRFRMVLDRNRVKDGRGVMPDVYVGPSAEAIRRGVDVKVLKVRDLIGDRAKNP